MSTMVRRHHPIYNFRKLELLYGLSDSIDVYYSMTYLLISDQFDGSLTEFPVPAFLLWVIDYWGLALRTWGWSQYHFFTLFDNETRGNLAHHSAWKTNHLGYLEWRKYLAETWFWTTLLNLSFSAESDPSGKYVWYLPPLLHLIKFKVNKVHVALEMDLENFYCKCNSCNLRQ